MNEIPEEVHDQITEAIAPLGGEWSHSGTVRFPLADPILGQMNAIESVPGIAHGFVGTEDGQWRVFRPVLK